uniref:AlNc14C55G4214 protein n=1 Tax=Albugo laibachii Nc14 TaxID=890382 RepID=F0WC31_9STRA|nr:AlNc14C55G4214 [Albugo laibachii Nc14]|eukprot:CCA18729.1 AlNc14C55G4214 [Albugo laibachii Nc14]
MQFFMNRASVSSYKQLSKFLLTRTMLLLPLALVARSSFLMPVTLDMATIFLPLRFQSIRCKNMSPCLKPLMQQLSVTEVPLPKKLRTRRADMINLVECSDALSLIFTFLEHRGLQNYLIAVQRSRELRKDLFNSGVWKNRLKYHLAIESTDLPELLPKYDDNFLARVPKTERYPYDPPEFEILNSCSEMKTYVAIATLMQCYVYFVKRNIAVSYQVNGSSVDIVVIPRALLKFFSCLMDENEEIRCYPAEAESKVYGIHLNVLDALRRDCPASCPIVVFMSSGSENLVCVPASNREYVLAMKALIGLMDLYDWSIDIEAFPTSAALREGSMIQDRNVLWRSILSPVFPHSDIFYSIGESYEQLLTSVSQLINGTTSSSTYLSPKQFNPQNRCLLCFVEVVMALSGSE